MSLLKRTQDESESLISRVDYVSVTVYYGGIDGGPSFEVDTATSQLADRPPLLISPVNQGLSQEAGVVPKAGGTL